MRPGLLTLKTLVLRTKPFDSVGVLMGLVPLLSG